MSLKLLHENYMSTSSEQLIRDQFPIKTSLARNPVVPMSSWEITDDRMEKVFYFERISDKSDMVMFLVEYEERNGHFASTCFTKNKVKVCLRSDKDNPDKSLDKQYAKFADDTYKSLITLTREQ